MAPYADDTTATGAADQPDPARAIMARHPGAMAADEVVEVNRSEFSGYVYNLETRDGWYVADGIVTHNCRCSWRTLLPTVTIPDEGVREAVRQLRERALQP
jgi:hypothetical protein